MANYFKNTDLAARYNISEATVRNWIKSAKQGKLQLELTTHMRRAYVAKSVRNIPIIRELVDQNRKYRNSLAVKTVTASSELFNVFNEAQIYDIVRNLELHHEIPRQYGYFGHDAIAWDRYIQKQILIDAPSILKRTIDLLADNYSYLDARMLNYEKVNVIDVGVGNALPVKGLLKHISSQGKMGRYIAVDFSRDMLKVAERNLKKWFGSAFKFEGYEFDMAHERFTNIVAEDYLAPRNETMNIFLLLGGTPTNLRSPRDAFRTVCESMNPHDLLIYTDRLELPEDSPEWLEYSYDIKPRKPELLGRHRFVLDKLNIPESFYEPEIGFDAVLHQRYSQAKLKFALKIKINFGGGERTVRFEKGDKILLWRAWQLTPQSLLDLLTSAGFYTLHTSQTPDRNYILTISEVKHD